MMKRVDFTGWEYVSAALPTMPTFEQALTRIALRRGDGVRVAATSEDLMSDDLEWFLHPYAEC